MKKLIVSTVLKFYKYSIKKLICKRKENNPIGYYAPSGYMYGISKEKYNILILLNIIGCNRQKKMVSLKE